MLNIIKAQDTLKDLSDQQLGGQMQTGTVPQYLVLAEMQRRKKMRSEASAQGMDKPQTTVAEDIEQPDPMTQGVGSLPVQPPAYASGGIVSFDEGGGVSNDDEYARKYELLKTKHEKLMSEQKYDAAMGVSDEMGNLQKEWTASGSINPTPSADYSFEKPSAPAGIIDLPQSQEYIRPPSEVAKDYVASPEDPSVVVPMPNPEGDVPVEAPVDSGSFRERSVFDGALGKPTPMLSSQEDNYADVQGIPTLLPKMSFDTGAVPASKESEYDREGGGPDYVQPTTEELRKLAYGEDDGGGITSLPREYEPQAETQRRPDIDISGDGIPPEAPVDLKSFRQRAPISGSQGKPASMVVPQEDNYAELQGIPTLLPKQKFTTDVSAPIAPSKTGRSEDKSPTMDSKPKTGIAAYLDQLQGELEPPAQSDSEARRVSSELKDRTQRLEGNNLSMSLMAASAAMLSGDSPFAMVNIGKGFQAGLAKYASGEKDVRDLQKEIGALDIEVEKALNDRDMKLYNNKVAQRAAATELYNKALENDKTIDMHKGIAQIDSADRRYNTESTSANNRANNATSIEVANIHANANKGQGSALAKEKLDQKNEAQYNAMVQKRAALDIQIRDKTQMSSPEDRAEAMKTLNELDRVIKYLEPIVYPGMPQTKAAINPAYMGATPQGSKDGPTVKNAEVAAKSKPYEKPQEKSLEEFAKAEVPLIAERKRLLEAVKLAQARGSKDDLVDLSKRVGEVNRKLIEISKDKKNQYPYSK